ncbi:AraC family transcriptional regulator [Lachnotalea glycerini]|uniref:AraC family transcriptional regulator n=1 Tax=Lachnotalea glycerini TaxID=1763509 RepID=A0A255HYT1_9FIRM|nr:AraC family transcriptional regulator [Lachnotalea glycerini]PXV90096.1 AraC family transcriptional regulator [Lachnotalea glycerini]RDY32133.1 AraC family transcriptional regulator [Lachnotalea glycerini]
MIEFTSCKKAISECIQTKRFAIAHLYNEEKPMAMHIHDCYEIYYSVSGGKRFLIDNKYYEIHAGDIFIINQYESHYLDQIDSMVHERIIISIHPDYLKQLSTPETNLDYCFSHRPNEFSHRVELSKEQQQRFIYYIHKMASLSGFGSDILEQTAFTELMVLINSQFQAQCDLEAAGESYQYNSQVADILKYLNKNIRNDITIKCLADHFYLSESYICRIFKAETGTTINKYLTARRISIAKSLLNVGLSVTEVCEKSGFHDYSNFLKAFTKAVGISPKKYSQYSSS